MEEAVVSLSEAMTVILECWRGHGRIAEARMAFHAGRFSFGNIASRSIESVVITTLGDVVKARRGRRWGRINNWAWMRTSGQ